MMVTQAPRLPGSVTGRECPVREDGTQCARTVREGHLMCAAHWRQVPVDVRDLVWSAWRLFQRTGSDEAWGKYADVRERALAHFEPPADEVEPPPPSETVTLADLDDASLVLVVAPDGSTKMWWGDRQEAAAALLKVHAQITEGI